MPNTREKLIELLDVGATIANNICGGIACDDCDGYKNGCTFTYIADYLIANGVTVTDTNVGKWISVKDRLPHRNMECICRYTFPGGEQHFHQTLMYYATDKVPHFQHELGGCGMKVTHWMPLPEPPKGE